MTRMTKMEKEVVSLGVSYGKSIEFIAIAKDADAAKRFATTLNHMQRAGAKNIKVSTSDNEVYFTSEFTKKQKTKVCYFITKHANEQKVVIPNWIRSHGSFYKCYHKKEKIANVLPAPETTSVQELKERLAKQGKRKYTKRKSPASAPTHAIKVPQVHAPKKVSLFTKFVNWLFK